MSKNPESQIPDLVEKVVQGIEDVKGQNLTILDLRDIENSVAEFFVICDATSSTQANALSGSVEKVVRQELGEKPWHVEGTQNAQWILMDYVSVVVHIFQKETRDFYDIESLWGDAKEVALENLDITNGK
ncbi:MAG: ribosome silencing factor [Bacteroidota bacterium]|nr:ribosome silencing factor [Bacteroidota bacterium]MDX5429015.1 ribosome silencing factor [Bacteroidota bacterium]MDX5506679.1 ribosome silencing factor [Bacteroidota bacterium]